MNQILQVKEKNKKSKIVEKIILIFIIIISAVCLTLLGLGAYSIYQDIINGNIVLPSIGGKNTVIPEVIIPTITLEQTEENKLIINVQSEIGISSISYNWNSETIQTINLEGKTNIEKIIDMPIGENTIYVSAIDTDGIEAKEQETFIIESPKPDIELAVVGNYIKITITSEIELLKVTYRWNSENEKVEDMLTYENRNIFEKKIEIPIGQNTLNIVAIDSEGNEAQKSQEIKGVTKATTTTKVDDEYWHFTVTGKENIKTVEFEFNGKKYLMNTETFGKTKIVHYKIKLREGKNYLKVTSTTESNGVDTTSWEQEYTEE